ncbi:MAG TPA: L-serine ammonia-lyase, iron-sulfur-dependent subunit beta [Firmicutes bacterium]|nr:L-serine ammonia-lyase, iron-sulfur-dependent subunit beta [Bacillota bacterium]
MDVFDIIGPIMIGPSSSHTAGAARIGKYALNILGAKPVKADIYFSGSFAKTYKGHGTDKAIVAGILGMDTDDPGIKYSFETAEHRGLEFAFHTGEIENAHPNTAFIVLTSESGKTVEVQGASVGGGNIVITKINGTEVEITGKFTTMIVLHRNIPGMISDVTRVLAQNGINIGKFDLRRNPRGGKGVMIIELDSDVPEYVNDEIKEMDNVIDSTLLKAI